MVIAYGQCHSGKGGGTLSWVLQMPAPRRGKILTKMKDPKMKEVSKTQARRRRDFWLKTEGSSAKNTLSKAPNRSLCLRNSV